MYLKKDQTNKRKLCHLHIVGALIPLLERSGVWITQVAELHVLSGPVTLKASAPRSMTCTVEMMAGQMRKNVGTFFTCSQ